MLKEFMILASLLFFLSLVFSGCKPADMQKALKSITADGLSKHIRTLSSDEFEGRAPASKGEALTIEYIKKEFEKIGLEPGNGDSYFQAVPMVSILTDPATELHVEGSGKTATFLFGEQVVVSTRRVREAVSVRDSEMVFVGYGIVAPEYAWNDYAGIDARGKTVVMLVNDPGYATQDPALFKGNAMTYYGRWTYKFEEAARQGAEAVLIIHETKPAAYPWDVVRNSWTGPQFQLIADDDNMSRCAVEGWVPVESVRAIFSQAGLDFDRLKAAAAKPGFKAVPMKLNASISLRNTIRTSQSCNVVGILPGKARKDEFIFYMAHWDHLGMDPALADDPVYHGALDNATGVAGLIELARAFRKLPSRPARSIAFMAVTAEEQGLLGSEYYATHPIYPLAKTVAAVNMDGLNIYGKMKDITVTGYGSSELDAYVESAAAAQGRTVRPDPEPEKGMPYRTDAFSFSKQGIPSLDINAGLDHVEHGEEWTRARMARYTESNYHKPSDKYDPAWDLSGMVEDLRLLLRLGADLASEESFPNWKKGTEFRAKRDADMQAASSGQ
jgi:Zn-dependent M28 family amino/carboxypeptidase